LVIFGYFWLFLVIFGNLRMGNFADVVFFFSVNEKRFWSFASGLPTAGF